MIPTVTVVATIPARTDPEGTVYSADARSHRTANDPANRSSGTVAAGRSFLGAPE